MDPERRPRAEPNPTGVTSRMVRHEFASSATSVAGIRVHSRVIGPADGSPVVLLPGLGMSNRSLVPLARALADHHRVWVLDPPGSGGGERPGLALDVDDLAEILLGRIEAHELEVPVLVAVSVGCQVAVEAARRDPRGLAALILISPPFGPRARSAGRQAIGLARSAPVERLGLMATIGLDWVRSGLPGVLRLARAAARYPLEAALGEVTVPVLILRGAHDPVAPPEWVDRLADDSAGRVRVVAGAGHGVHDAAPVRVAEAIDAFLGEVG